jgi:hypothetical protein
MQLNDPANSSNLAVEQVHRNFMRYVLRVRENTSTWVVYREAGMYPVHHKWLANMLTFLRGILQLDGREHAKIAMLHCIALYCR